MAQKTPPNWDHEPWVRRVIDEARLKAREQAVLRAIARHANHDTGVAWLKLDTIATAAKYRDKSSARDAVKELERRGILRVDRRPGRNQVSHYALVYDWRCEHEQLEAVLSALRHARWYPGTRFAEEARTHPQNILADEKAKEVASKMIELGCPLDEIELELRFANGDEIGEIVLDATSLDDVREIAGRHMDEQEADLRQTATNRIQLAGGDPLAVDQFDAETLRAVGGPLTDESDVELLLKTLRRITQT